MAQFFKQDPRRSPMMQQALALMGNQPRITDLGGGVSSLGRSIAGALMANKAEEKYKLDRMQKQATLDQAMRAATGWKDPDTGELKVEGGGMNAMAAALAGNPDTADMGMQIKLANMQADQAANRAETQLNEQRQYDEGQLANQREYEQDSLTRRLENNIQVAKAKGDLDMSNSLEKMLAEHRLKYGDMGGPQGQRPPTQQASIQSMPTVGNLGAPLPDADPLAGLPPQEAAKLASKLRGDAISGFASGEKGASDAQNMIERLDRFVSLLDAGLDTGGQYKIPGAQGLAAGFDPEIAEAKSIIDAMTPMMRQGMPGAASDRDVGMFRGATVGLDKPEVANRNIAKGLSLSRQNLLERREFRQAYFDQNKHLQGADRAWKKYLNTNPIFDHKKKDYTLNAGRKSWREHFSGKPAPAEKYTVGQRARDPRTGEIKVYTNQGWVTETPGDDASTAQGSGLGLRR